MDWNDLSELNFGLIIDSRRDANMYHPDNFTAPYSVGVKTLQQPGATKEDLAKVISSKYITDAHNAVKKMNGIGETENFDWGKALIKAQQAYEISKILSKTAKRLEGNDEVDLLPVYGQLGSIINGESSGLSAFSKIEYGTYKPFMKTGYDPLDKVIGGIPTDGPIVIFGSSGIGKSTLVAKLVSCLLKTHPDKRGAVYTLEMPAEHWAWRTAKAFPEILEVQDRLYVSGSVKNIDELVAEVMAGQYDFVVLDDIDNCVASFDASAYEMVFKRVKEVCRFMGVPFFVIAQVTKEAESEIEGGKMMKDGKRSKSRFPRKTDVAWSATMYKSAALLIAVHTVWDGIDMDDTRYPTEEGIALDYLLIYKSREQDEDKFQIPPGAIVLHHKHGWSGKFYQNKVKLWGGKSNFQKGADDE